MNALLNGEYLYDGETKANPPAIEGTGLIPVVINEDGTHTKYTAGYVPVQDSNKRINYYGGTFSKRIMIIYNREYKRGYD